MIHGFPILMYRFTYLVLSCQPMELFSSLQECYLKAHQLTHSGIKQFKCDSCGRGFHQKANMERHRLIHRASRAFECEVCHKSFTQLQVLKAHQVTHSKKKPFQCQLCGMKLIHPEFSLLICCHCAQCSLKQSIRI